jgi:predicted phage terminase large subunit-like protein
MARKHPADLAPLVFTTDDQEPMIPQPFHREWLDALMRGGNVLLKAPRGHAKSEYASGVYPAWLIGTNPSTRIVLVTGEDEKATMHTRRLRALFNDPLYRAIFPGLPPLEKATETELNLVGSGAHPTWSAAGIGSINPGGRADLIILDDAVTEKNSRSRVMRDQTWVTYSQVVLPMLKPGGKVLVIGTPWHEEDLYSRLEANEQFKFLKYKAEYPSGKILWPKRFTKAVLAKAREDMGEDAYVMQMLCEIVLSSGDVFHRDWFDPPVRDIPRDKDKEPLMHDLWWVWDTAIGAETSNDYTAGLLGGSDTFGNAYVMAARRGKWRPEESRGNIVAAYRRSQAEWGPLLRGILLEDTKEARVLKSWIDSDITTRDIPILLTPHHNMDKYARAAQIVPKCEAGNVKILESVDKAFLHELLSFQRDGRHATDDWCDAFTYLLARLFYGIAGLRGARRKLMVTQAW